MSRELWIFGYGSLLWDPGFEPEEVRHAVLRGYRRSFCMWSHHHRGTPSRPGLVLALEPSESSACRGMALKAADNEAGAVLSELRRRELISYAYEETAVRLDTAGGAVSALAYVVNRGHHQYCRIGPEQQARTIAAAGGGRGSNRDYLEKTAAKLNELGIGDPALDSLLRRVRRISSGNIPER